MKKLHTFGLWERALASLYCERLRQEGIGCLVRNDDLMSVMGEIPLVECYPELWVIDDETWPRARLLLDAWQSGDPQPPSWTCPGCGEVIEGQFCSCWKCGRDKP